MFEKAIDMLRSEETKPASMFGSAEISPNDIEQITAFLQEVAEQIADGEHHDRSRSPSPESRLIGRFLLVMAAWVPIPVHRGQSFRRIADSVPVIADSC